MLMDILMESLMSMDEYTLDYVLESCSDEEIGLIDDMVMEASGDGLSSADKEKINRITEIQAAARERGWASVAPKDRKYYVSTITAAKDNKAFLSKLKTAKRIGEKEGASTSKLNKALSIFTKGDAALNAITLGAQTGLAASLSGDPGIIAGSTLGGAVVGGGMGAVHGAAISGIIKEIDKCRRYDRDKHDLALQGDYYHPEDAWKGQRRRQVESKIANARDSLSAAGNR